MLQWLHGKQQQQGPAAEPVVDEIHVVAALGHQRERAPGLITPVSSKPSQLQCPPSNIYQNLKLSLTDIQIFFLQKFQIPAYIRWRTL